MHDWLKDATVAKKEKDFFRSLINRGNILDKSDFPDCEFLLESDSGKRSPSTGCLAAYEWESFVISFPSLDRWKAGWINGIYVTIESEDLEVKILNCSMCEHIANILSEEKQKNQLLISSGSDLWEKRSILYPHLIFCDSVKRQLEEARISLQIHSIMAKIQILEDYFKTYQGIFDKDELGYGCRYESKSVQNDDNLKNLRKFVTPYGNEEFFYWHISFPGNYPGRIHFIPDAEHRVGIIGYIGKHLPTRKFSTF